MPTFSTKKRPEGSKIVFLTVQLNTFLINNATAQEFFDFLTF